MKARRANFGTTVRGFIRKELVQTLRDPRMRAMLILVPLIQLTVFGLALTSDVRNIKLAAHAEMRDPMMQDIIRDAVGGGWFVRADASPAEEAEGFAEIRAGKAEVALFAPEGGLTRAFIRGDGKLQALIDSADLVRARSIENDVRAIAGRVALGYGGHPHPPPVRFASRLLYNPEMVSAYYLVPGVIGMLLSIITIMMTSMSIAREREVGTLETLIAAPVKPIEILAGKTIPFIIIGLVDLPLVLAIALWGFGVPMRGTWIELVLAMVFFLLTTVSIGTLISTIARSQQQAMMGGFLFIMPAILLSGIMFPIDNMPDFLKWVAHLNPLMYFITLLRNIMLKGGDPGVILSDTAALAAIAAVSVTVAVKRFHMRLN